MSYATSFYLTGAEIVARGTRFAAGSGMDWNEIGQDRHYPQCCGIGRCCDLQYGFV